VFAVRKSQHRGSTPRETPRNFGRNKGVVRKKGSRRTKANIFEMRQDIAAENKRKSYTRFRLVPKSAILDDFEGS